MLSNESAALLALPFPSLDLSAPSARSDSRSSGKSGASTTTIVQTETETNPQAQSYDRKFDRAANIFTAAKKSAISSTKPIRWNLGWNAQ
jgi:hypothetical protein